MTHSKTGQAQCVRCLRRAPAVASMGFERVRIAAAAGTFEVTKWSGATETLALCVEDARAMRSAGWRVVEVAAAD